MILAALLLASTLSAVFGVLLLGISPRWTWVFGVLAIALAGAGFAAAITEIVRAFL